MLIFKKSVIVSGTCCKELFYIEVYFKCSSVREKRLQAGDSLHKI